MTIRIDVDVAAAAPPYEQIRSQIAAHIAAGTLKDGDRLPSVRALAQDLGIAVGTANRAYRELEVEGLVATRRRTGTVVTAPSMSADAVRRESVRAEAAAEVAALVTRLREAGLTDAEILDHVRGALLINPGRPGPTQTRG